MILTIGKEDNTIPAKRIIFVIYLILSLFLLKQPDFGGFILLSGLLFSQLFIAGMPFIYVIVFILIGMISINGAYLVLSHVATRINNFL